MAKKKTAAKAIVPPERVQQLIVMFRGQKVVLSHDLAELYGVEHRALNQAVQRNRARFPDDFMFQLTSEEFDNLKSQIVISSWGGRRTPPYAFTEQGVAMLSSVLNSEQAIAVNIEIMRAFVRGIMGPTVRAQLAENPNRQLAVECHDTQPGDSKLSVWVPGRCAASGGGFGSRRAVRGVSWAATLGWNQCERSSPKTQTDSLLSPRFHKPQEPPHDG